MRECSYINHCCSGMIGSGKSNISSVVSVCQSQMKDGPVAPAIAAFASLGAHGAHTNNEERDLHVWLKGLHGMHLDVYFTTVQIEAGRLDKGIFNLTKKESCPCLPKTFFVRLFPKLSYRIQPFARQVVNSDKLEDVAIPCWLPHEVLHAVALAGPRQVWGSKGLTNARTNDMILLHIIVSVNHLGRRCIPTNIVSSLYQCWVAATKNKYKNFGTTFSKWTGGRIILHFRIVKLVREGALGLVFSTMG